MANLTKITLEKHKLVIDEWFVNSFVGYKAYMSVYKSCTEKNAMANFGRIKQHPQIVEYIESKREDARRIVDVTKEGLLLELKNWLEFDMTETIDIEISELKKLPITLRRLIKNHKVSTRTIYDSKGNEIEKIKNVELSFVSKEKAIDMLARHIGFYEKDNEQKAAEINLDIVSPEALMEIFNARKTDD